MCDLTEVLAPARAEMTERLQRFDRVQAWLAELLRLVSIQPDAVHLYDDFAKTRWVYKQRFWYVAVDWYGDDDEDSDGSEDGAYEKRSVAVQMEVNEFLNGTIEASDTRINRLTRRFDMDDDSPGAIAAFLNTLLGKRQLPAAA